MPAPLAEIELNDEQFEVVAAPAEARLLVIAGAGQGKTEVVARRIAHLVQDDGLTASEEILVLSFSRAAVTAVRTRLGLRDVSATNVRTFDSFASMLLLDAGIQPEGSFDERIRRTTQMLGAIEEAPYHVGMLRHIVIDEVQDLVGDRADFVRSVLSWLPADAGITALGDPLQGVFDFQLRGSLSQTTSEDFLRELGRTFGCELKSLGRNYRARGGIPKRVVQLGEELWRCSTEVRQSELIDDLYLDIPDRREIEEWYRLITPAQGTSIRTAVLCAINADVLRVSRFLNEHSVPHAVRRQAQDFGAARWIAGALGHLPGPKERRSEIETALARLLGDDRVEPSWNELKSAEGRTRDFDALDLLRVNSLVRARALPLALTEPDVSSVIVSTIHRAKGLEFDSVFIVEPTYVPPGEKLLARVRRDYVALSRARDSIFKCKLSPPDSLIRQEPRIGGRLAEDVWRKSRQGSWTQAFEFQYGDVESDCPASSRTVTAAQVQINLRSISGVGVSVSAQLDGHESSDSTPSYLLFANGVLIGRTSSFFNNAFATIFGWLPKFPKTIDGLSLVAVETVAGDPRVSEREGVGSSGFWLVPRLVGMARPNLSRK